MVAEDPDIIKFYLPPSLFLFLKQGMKPLAWREELIFFFLLGLEEKLKIHLLSSLIIENGWAVYKSLGLGAEYIAEQMKVYCISKQNEALFFLRNTRR